MSGLKILGTGRPNKLLIRDYAEVEGGHFRVETDVELNRAEFDDLESWLGNDTPENKETILKFLHKKVDDENKLGKENAKKMFSAAFDA